MVANMSVFEWWQYDFMQNAFWALLIIAPLLAIVGSLVVNARLSFFSDAIGHSALTGVALGVLLRLQNPSWMIIIYSLILSFVITFLKYKIPQKTDMFIALIMSFSVALGLVLLTHTGQFSKFSTLLVGDLLSIQKKEIYELGLLLLLGLLFLFFSLKKIVLVSLSTSLARSRGINVFLVEVLFSSFVAIVVSLCIPWVGLLVINSLLVLPAATSNNVSKGMKNYLLGSLFISIFASIVGLILSYYLSSATGATIVLVLMSFFVISLFLMKSLRK